MQASDGKTSLYQPTNTFYFQDALCGTEESFNVYFEPMGIFPIWVKMLMQEQIWKPGTIPRVYMHADQHTVVRKQLIENAIHKRQGSTNILLIKHASHYNKVER